MINARDYVNGYWICTSTNSFGDLILKMVEDDGKAETTLTYQEGSWPELSTPSFELLIKQYC